MMGGARQSGMPALNRRWAVHRGWSISKANYMHPIWHVRKRPSARAHKLHAWITLLQDSITAAATRGPRHVHALRSHCRRQDRAVACRCGAGACKLPQRVGVSADDSGVWTCSSVRWLHITLTQAFFVAVAVSLLGPVLITVCKQMRS